jgi:hypothetical protein
VTALLVALGTGVHAQGGYGPLGPLLIGLPLLAALLLVRPRSGPWRAAGPVLLLGLWAVIDAGLHGEPAAGLGALGLAIAVSAVLFVVSDLDGPGRGLLLDGLAGIGALLGLFTWAGLVLRVPGWVLPAQSLWRSGGTVGYANAAAAVLVLLALLTAAGRDRDPDRPLAPGLIRLLTVLLLVGAAATLSRGGLLALLAGLAVLALTTRGRGLVDLLPSLAGAAVAAAGLVPSVSVTTPGRPLVAVAGLVAGLLAARLLERPRWRRPVAGTLLLAGAALAAVAAPVASVAVRTRIEAGSAHRGPALEAGRRLLAEQPWLGTGPGNAVLRWHDGGGHVLRLLHDEYLQVVLEYGLVGGVLLAAVLAGWLGRLRRPERPAAVAALAAFALHSGLDILWHVPVLPLLAAAALALAAPSARAHELPPSGGSE